MYVATSIAEYGTLASHGHVSNVIHDAFYARTVGIFQLLKSGHLSYTYLV